MSNALAIVEGDIYSVQDSFNRVLSDKSINFDREAQFAIQIISANEYAIKVATSNRQSVIDAMTNVAAVGLSLNPAKKQAYLVPRKGGICLAISYRGLIDLAVDCGAIAWAKAELVYVADTFELVGMDKAPIHQRNPFASDRGEVIGCYVVAKLPNGDYLTEAMSIAEINAIRDRSDAWKAYKEKGRACPWVTDPGEMCKKTVVNRASKSWRGSGNDRLDQAIHYMNTDGGEGITFANEQPKAEDKPAFDRVGFIEEAKATTTKEALTAVWARAAKAARDAGDAEGHAAVKKVVVGHAAKLDAVDVETKGEV